MARRARAPETARETALIALALLGFCTGLIVLMLALVLGFHIENTPGDMADTAKGQAIAVPALVALVTGVVALAGRRRSWAVALGWVGAAAAVLAVVLTVLLPGGEA